MKKMIVVGLLILVASGMSAPGALNWFNNLNARITYRSGGTAYLYTSEGDSSTGCFLQLIYTGTSGSTQGSIGNAVNSGTGVTGVNQVVEFSYFGNEQEAPVDSGVFYGATTLESKLVTNGWYFVRAWTAPSANFLSGTVPSSLTNFYGNSAQFQYPGQGNPPQNANFNFGGSIGWSTTLSPIAIPEPAVFGLSIIGLISLRMFARKRK
jgi:hypothetical protein